jgi:hypothetical protein
MDFNGYEIFVTDQELPHLESAWTTVELTQNNSTYKFKRETNKSRIFKISGYISKATWTATRTEAEGLNDSLNTTPSGTFTDGYGTTYSVLVEDWSITPVAAMNKYEVSMSFRMVT